MDLQRIAGIVIITGVVFFVAGMFTAPPRVYEGTDISKRLQIIADNQIQWNLSKVFDGLSVVTPACGFLLLAFHLWNRQNSFPIALGTATLVIAAILGAVYVFRLATNPAQYWTKLYPAPLAIAFLLSLIAGLFFYGIVFLQGSFPNWLGYLTIGGAILGLVGYLALRSASPFYITALMYIIILVAGIMQLRTAT